MRYVIVAFVSILAILAAFWKLNSARDGLSIGHESAGSTPVTIFKLASAKPGPAIVIAHGFAGSQQLMQPFALTLARNGYVAVTFDFLGHGRNPEPIKMRACTLCSNSSATWCPSRASSATADWRC
jgi:pimeloyl-ACP methyl ester carboxylesterase